MKKDQLITFSRIIGDVFKVRLEAAGWKTICRPFRGNSRPNNGPTSFDVHIQGTRKKHKVSITNTKYRPQDKQSYYIEFRSERLKNSYVLWDSSFVEMDMEDPRFSIDADAMADKVIEFMKHIKDIDESLFKAHTTFGVEHKTPYKKGYDPDRKRVGVNQL